MPKLDGKVALITGASRGIGRGIALEYAKEGASIGVNYKSNFKEAKEVVKLIHEIGSSAIILHGDITRDKDVARITSKLVRHYGRIDILVNNAGIATKYSLLEMPTEAWDILMAVHLRGMFLCSKAVIPYMLKLKSGKIINISGSFGISGEAEFVHLSTAKAGMIGFTRALAKELGKQNIQVNAIAPSMIATDLMEQFSKEYLNSLCKRYPLGRIGAIKDVTATAVFLASDDSDFYTGQTLCPTGGDVMV